MIHPDKRFGIFLLTVFSVLVATGLGLQFMWMPSDSRMPVYTPTPSVPSAVGTDYITTEKSGDTTNKTPPNIFPLNLNTASAKEFEQLDGIGPLLAQRIVDYRENVTLFTQIEDIKNVSGIGEAIFTQIKDYIWVESGLSSTAQVFKTETSASPPSENISKVPLATYRPVPEQNSTTKKTPAVTATTQTITFPIEMNTATPQEWQALPGIGETLAARIIRYREEVSAFYSVEELMDVDGIGAVLFNKIKDKIYVDTSRLPPLISGTDNIHTEELLPVNLNTATIEDLQRLPNLTPQLAANILRYRDEISGGHLDSIYEILSTEGMTNAIFTDIMDYITI